MHRSQRVLVLLLLLSCASNVVSTFHKGSPRQSRLPRAPSLPQQRNLTTMPSLLKPTSAHDPPSDPWVYSGAHGLYRLSSYTSPSILLTYLSSFMFACLADLFDDIANQNIGPHQPYPDGRYDCKHNFAFSHGPPAIFSLELVKVNAPSWDFTYSDIGADLSAIFNAAQYFELSTYGVPQMEIEVFRYRNGEGGRTFLASQGGFEFIFPLAANLSVT